MLPLDDAALLLEVPAEALQVRREVARGPLPPGGATVRGTGRGGGAPAPSGPGRWAWVPPMWEYLHPLSVRTQIRRNGSRCKVKRFGMSDPRFAGSNWRLPHVACPTPGSLAGAALRGGGGRGPSQETPARRPGAREGSGPPRWRPCAGGGAPPSSPGPGARGHMPQERRDTTLLYFTFRLLACHSYSALRSRVCPVLSAKDPHG